MTVQNPISISKKLRPRNGNITILGSGNFQKQMDAFGEVLAKRLGNILNRPVSFVLLGMKNDQQKRLCLTICGSGLEEIKEKLIPNFDVFHVNQGTEKECLRAWGIPLDFIASDAEKIKSYWKDLFKFSARISRKGDLELSVSSKDNDEEMLADFRKELEKDSSETIIRDKQKHRRGTPSPGFIIIFSVTTIHRETEKRELSQVKPLGLSQESQKEGVEEQIKVHAPGEKSINGLIPVEDVLHLCLTNLTFENQIELLKKLLPQGVGLYDTTNPLSLDGKGVVVNSL